MSTPKRNDFAEVIHTLEEVNKDFNIGLLFTGELTPAQIFKMYETHLESVPDELISDDDSVSSKELAAAETRVREIKNLLKGRFTLGGIPLLQVKAQKEAALAATRAAKKAARREAGALKLLESAGFKAGTRIPADTWLSSFGAELKTIAVPFVVLLSIVYFRPIYNAKKESITWSRLDDEEVVFDPEDMEEGKYRAVFTREEVQAKVKELATGPAKKPKGRGGASSSADPDEPKSVNGKYQLETAADYRWALNENDVKLPRGTSYVYELSHPDQIAAIFKGLQDAWAALVKEDPSVNDTFEAY